MGRDDPWLARRQSDGGVLAKGNYEAHAFRATAASLRSAYQPIDDGAPFNDLLTRLDRAGR